MAYDACSRGTNHVIEQDEDDQAPRGLRIGPLMTSGDVKREAGRLYRSARRGELSSADASRLASVLALIARVIEGCEIESRLAALEAKAP
jgi:hypothetical protein